MHFLIRLIDAHTVTMFVLALLCLFGYGYPGYTTRAEHGYFWLLWLIGGIMALVAWIVLVFS